jgi:hypothetical protein
MQISPWITLMKGAEYVAIWYSKVGLTANFVLQTTAKLVNNPHVPPLGSTGNP